MLNALFQIDREVQSWSRRLLCLRGGGREGGEGLPGAGGLPREQIQCRRLRREEGVGPGGGHHHREERDLRDESHQ